MRYIIRKILFYTALAALLTYFALQGRMDTGLFSDSDYKRFVNDAARYVVSRVDDNRSVTFSVPPNIDRLKVLSNAAVSRTVWLQPYEKHIAYAVHYRVYDSSKNVLAQKRYHHTTISLPPAMKSADGQYIQPRFYLDDTTVPMPTKTFIIDLRVLEGADTIEFFLESSGDLIENMALRLYRPEVTQPKKVEQEWLRMSQKEKGFFALNNVYPKEFVTLDEMRNNLALQWRPHGPLGLGNIDYEEKTLYLYKDIETAPYVKESFVYAERFASGDLEHTQYLKEGSYRIALNALDENATSNVSLRFYSQGKEQRPEIRQLQLNGYLDIEFTPEREGLLEIASEGPVDIAITDLQSRKEVPFEPLKLRYYSVVNEPLTYCFESKLERPLRLDARQLSAVETEIRLRYREGDRTLRSFDFSISSPLSRYDYMDNFVPASESNVTYMVAPKKTECVDIIASQPVLIRLMTRPFELSYPVDRRNSEKYKALTWFDLLPVKDSYTKEQEVLLSKLQQPQKLPQWLSSGVYGYAALRPESMTVGEFFMSFKDDSEAVRESALESLWSLLPLNRSLAVEFAANAAMTQTVPELIYLNNAHKPVKLSLYLDGVIWDEVTLSASSGRYRLPRVADGKQTLRIAANGDLKVWINYLKPQWQSYLGRHYYRFDKRLTFTFDKRKGEESLKFSFIDTAASDKSERRFNVRIKPFKRLQKNRYDYLSFPQRDVTSGRLENEVFSLRKRTDAALYTTASVVLGDDLPAGRYSIEVEPQGSSGLYLFAYVIDDERESQTRLRSEVW